MEWTGRFAPRHTPPTDPSSRPTFRLGANGTPRRRGNENGHNYTLSQISRVRVERATQSRARVAPKRNFVGGIPPLATPPVKAAIVPGLRASMSCNETYARRRDNVSSRDGTKTMDHRIPPREQPSNVRSSHDLPLGRSSRVDGAAEATLNAQTHGTRYDRRRRTVTERPSAAHLVSPPKGGAGEARGRTGVEDGRGGGRGGGRE